LQRYQNRFRIFKLSIKGRNQSLKNNSFGLSMDELINDILMEDTDKNEGTNEDLDGNLEEVDQEDLDAWDIEEDLEE